MAYPIAQNNEAQPQVSGQAAFGLLLSRVVIRALCPPLQSEISFGQPQNMIKPQTFEYWTDEFIEGDLRGQLALAVEPYTLNNLTHCQQSLTGKSEGQDLEEILASVFERIKSELVALLGQDDLKCHLTDRKSIKKDFRYSNFNHRTCLYPIETRFGILRLILSLDSESTDAVSLQYGVSEDGSYRKIRISAPQLDTLENSVHRLESLESKLLQGPDIRSRVRDEIRRIKRTVYHMKLEPIELLFSPARRLALSLSKAQGKQVSIQTHGTWVYLNKNLLNYLYSPILHLVRNAVDHGIEDPSERERRGKPAKGLIKCLAGFSHLGLRLIISDDGYGLNIEKIRSQAISRGLLDENEALGRLSENVHPLIFKTGFSTRNKSDATSGRGLGLDVVKKELEAIGGKIRILSTSHHGTSFEVFVPLNQELTVDHLNPIQSVEEAEEAERSSVVEELDNYFERTYRLLDLIKEHNSDETLSNAYEIHRILTAIKGVCGFAGWHRIATLCSHLEELFSAVSSKQLDLDSRRLKALRDSIQSVQKFCEISNEERPFSLYEYKKIEAKILRYLWRSSGDAEKTRLPFGRTHLQSVQELCTLHCEENEFSSRKESDFVKSAEQQFGCLMQFQGERNGYAAVLFDSEDLTRLLAPIVSGCSERASIKTQFWALGEFGNQIAQKMVEKFEANNLRLSASAPLTLCGTGHLLSLVGTPTYAYQCRARGLDFHIVGDFWLPFQGPGQASNLREEESKVLECQKKLQTTLSNHFEKMGAKIQFSETASQSDLVGFEQGITTLYQWPGDPSLFIVCSLDPTAASWIGLRSNEQGWKSSDLFESLTAFSENLIKQLGKSKTKNQPGIQGTHILGKAYIGNLSRLYETNKLIGEFKKGRLEVQLILTDSNE